MLACRLHSILTPRSHFTSIYFFVFLFAYSRSKLVFYVFFGGEVGKCVLDSAYFLACTDLANRVDTFFYWRFPLPLSTNLILISNLGKDRKIKKENRVKCDLGASLEYEPISKYSRRSDYWHIYPIFFFYFSSVSNKLN